MGGTGQMARMSDLDPRINAFRPDLAATKLLGQVESARFADGEPAVVARALADLRRRPEASAPLDTQLLFGETVTVFDRADGWAWVQNATDDYVGYVEAAALANCPAGGPPSHTIKVMRTFLYPAPDVKTPPLQALSFLSPLRVVGTDGRFSEIALPGDGSGWVFSAHLAAHGEVEPDFVATAHMFLGVPYLWGGRSSLGLDCSAFIQLSLTRAGIACPRDSYVQERVIGTPVPWQTGRTELRRGDIVYFPGHVAIALDEAQVLHPNAGAMLTTIEPLADVVRRVERESGGRGVTSVRRIGL